jgi:type II secretory pathway pseudopilin PulG
VDLLVSIAVVAVLIGLLLPSLRLVHETSKRVVCQSNLRQVGLGMHMYATDNDSWLPPSAFALGFGPQWESNPMYLRIDGRTRGYDLPLWDGMGYLFAQTYLTDGRIFYCPSHTGAHPFEAYTDRFDGAPGEIQANYQYRGIGPNGEARLDLFDDTVALISDGFAEVDDINHRLGMNILRAGMSVDWFLDRGNVIEDIALSVQDDDTPSWEDGWRILDQPVQNGGFWDTLFP